MTQSVGDDGLRPQSKPLDRNLALELVRVTEAGALASSPLLGRGDKEAADQGAVDAMRSALASVDMQGVVVIGEGEKDEAPMLYIGEEIGNGLPPQVDVAVDPIDGTRLLANGMPGALSVVALSERGSMFHTHVAYMEKIVVGPRARDLIDMRLSVADNLRRIAEAEECELAELTVVALNRERNLALVEQVRAAGARIKLISDGDVSAAIRATMEFERHADIHVLMGIGGATEGVLAACAVKCLGGGMQARLWFRDQAEERLAVAEGNRPGAILGLADLCAGDNVFFAATGITGGEFLEGVRYTSYGARTQSVVMRSASETVRFVDSLHRIQKVHSIVGTETG